jgi:UrcA family protein
MRHQHITERKNPMTNTFSLKAAAVSLVATMAVLATAQPAAADQVDRQSVVVLVDSIALRAGSPQAVQQAHNEVVNAANQACGTSTLSRRDLEARRDSEACVANAVDAVLTTTQFPALRAYAAALPQHQRYQRHLGQAPAASLAAVAAFRAGVG